MSGSLPRPMLSPVSPDASATTIDDSMLVAAAHAIASTVHSDELNANYIIPSVFHEEVHKAVAAAVRGAAQAAG